MIVNTRPTGTSGEMKIVDNTDNPDLKTVEMWVRAEETEPSIQIPWAFSLGNNRSNWSSFLWKPNSEWQRLGSVYVSTPNQFTFHLGDTGSEKFGGPTDLVVDLYGFNQEFQNRSVYIWVDGVYKNATPYVRVNGVWTPNVTPYVKTPFEWQPLS